MSAAAWRVCLRRSPAGGRCIALRSCLWVLGWVGWDRGQAACAVGAHHLVGLAGTSSNLAARWLLVDMLAVSRGCRRLARSRAFVSVPGRFVDWGP